jgi:hypothetical protein
MIPLFIALTSVNLLCLATAAAVGYLGARGDDWFGPWHTITGVMATMTCCAVHCIVFTYFMATAKWVQHAVSVKRLDPQLTSPTRSFRAQALPAALLAIAIVFASAVLGAAHENYAIPRNWHELMALASFVVNALVAWIEYRAITRNGRLIDDVLERIAQQKVPAAV